jgi:transposase
MARTAQISKEKKQSIITLRHEGQSVQKISRTLTVSLSAVAKTIKRYDETGSHEDRHMKGRPRVTSAAEDKLIILSYLTEDTRNCSTNKCFKEFK